MGVKEPFGDKVKQGFEGRDLGVAPMAGFEDDEETVSHAVRLHRKRKDALQKIFKSMGMDLGTGIRMVVYKWLDDRMKGRG
jgi:hypothetical protein